MVKLRVIVLGGIMLSLLFFAKASSNNNGPINTSYQQSPMGCVLVRIFSNVNLFREYMLSFEKGIFERDSQSGNKDNLFDTEAVIHRDERRRFINEKDNELIMSVTDKYFGGAYISYEYPWEWSPDQEKIAISVRDRGKYAPEGPYKVAVVDIKRKEVVFTRIFENKYYIRDMTWNSTSTSIAILVASEKKGLMPWELVAMIAGHPVPYVSFHLEVQDISTGILSQYPIINNVKYGSGSILWIKDNKCKPSRLG